MSRGKHKAMIRCDHLGLGLSRQCGLLLISSSSVYYARNGEGLRNLGLMCRVDVLFLKYPFYGLRHMVCQLWRDDFYVGRHRGLQVDAIDGSGGGDLPAPENQRPPSRAPGLSLSAQGMAIKHPNQVWYADITDIPVQLGFLYLVAIMDWATRHVLALRLSNTIDGRGRCMDNIFIERLWWSLKYEAVYLHELTDGFKTVRVIAEWIGFVPFLRNQLNLEQLTHHTE
jgi:putative transposase